VQRKEDHVVSPETRYARSGDVSVAFQIVGEGPIDLVYVPGFVSNVEMSWRVPDFATYLRRLAAFSRLIIFDKRGTGMSDRTSGVPTLETRMDDLRAVMDAAGSARAVVLGISEGGPMSILFAATYPERVAGLVLLATSPRPIWATDYPFGESIEDYDRWTRRTVDAWGSKDGLEALVAEFAPGYDEVNRIAMGDYLRQSASPGAVEALDVLNKSIDVRAILPAVRTPTCVLSLTGDRPAIVNGSRYMAERIQDARLVEIAGRGHHPTTENVDAIVSEVERFVGSLVGQHHNGETDGRLLATLLFTDIVDSTAHAARLGDRDWQGLLSRHHALVRRELTRYRGQELDTAGDGFFARFDGPGRAIRCAQRIVSGVRELGIEVRAGVHTGECELFERKVGGIAVSIGARVASQAGPGEVMVSSTVHDLVAGSGLSFEDRGRHRLKGLTGEWQLYAVRAPDQDYPLPESR
jgi:pimeloyl-ACP methyl ester carboxylesterase